MPKSRFLQTCAVHQTSFLSGHLGAASSTCRSPDFVSHRCIMVPLVAIRQPSGSLAFECFVAGCPNISPTKSFKLLARGSEGSSDSPGLPGALGSGAEMRPEGAVSPAVPRCPENGPPHSFFGRDGVAEPGNRAHL